ncbi:MAG: dihydrodipicolinate synthase family protein [Alphaproteobacteria bacterium]
MTHPLAARLTGIHAATIVPMRADFEIDEDALAGHIAAISHRPGIRGLLINGHAGENFVLDSAEKRRVIEIARKVAPPDCVICSGINAESSLQAARDAADAERAGADILLVFPPNSWALGHDDGVVDIHHRHVLEATSLPLMLYAAPVGAGRMAYSGETLTRLVAHERIIAVKEGSWEVAAYEANKRLLEALRPDFVVMGSGDEHLLTSAIVGSAGAQVSLAALVPDLLVEFFAATQAGDWTKARALHDSIYPLAVAIYRDAPGGRATARLKLALALTGQIAADHVRPPQPPPSQAERLAVTAAMRAARVFAG